MNLTSSKKEEVQRLQAQIDDLSTQYVQNINDDQTFLLFTESEIEGLPSELLQVIVQIYVFLTTGSKSVVFLLVIHRNVSALSKQLYCQFSGSWVLLFQKWEYKSKHTSSMP